MAERVEEPEAEAPESAPSPQDGVAAAMTAALRRRKGGVKDDPEFDAFLRKQSRLIDLQTEHLHDQRQVILLRLRLGAWKDRVTLALQSLTALVAMGIATAIAVEPKFAGAYHDRALALADVGHDEAAFADDGRADELIHRYGARYVGQDAPAGELAASDGQRAAAVGDFGKGVEDLRSLDLGGRNGDPTDILGALADYQARWHDVTAARQAEAELPPAPVPAVVPRQIEAAKQRPIIEAEANQALANWPALWRVYAGVDQSKAPAAVRQALAIYVAPEAALARAEMGDITGAKALIATTPLDCYPCARARGRIAAVAHDWAGADRWFAEAGKDAPRWGGNHLRWGEALMLAGRYAEATAQYQTANGLDLSGPDRAALNVLLARTASGPLHG